VSLLLSCLYLSREFLLSFQPATLWKLFYSAQSNSKEEEKPFFKSLSKGRWCCGFEEVELSQVVFCLFVFDIKSF